LEVNTQVVHAGKRHGVAQAIVTAGDEIIARANAAFAIT
jgi:acyl-coenzyme A thioesterase PaaI-like protein